jgi:hypothetical protein
MAPRSRKAVDGRRTACGAVPGWSSRGSVPGRRPRRSEDLVHRVPRQPHHAGDRRHAHAFAAEPRDDGTLFVVHLDRRVNALRPPHVLTLRPRHLLPRDRPLAPDLGLVDRDGCQVVRDLRNRSRRPFALPRWGDNVRPDGIILRKCSGKVETSRERENGRRKESGWRAFGARPGGPLSLNTWRARNPTVPSIAVTRTIGRPCGGRPPRRSGRIDRFATLPGLRGGGVPRRTGPPTPARFQHEEALPRILLR